jgi:superfamily II DNA or RNA helicase
MSTSFLDFYQSFDTDAHQRGKQFEHFVKWFLQNDPEWATQVERVWLWNDWPQRWGPDNGIDLVFRNKDGEFCAVQAKCYSPNHDITKHDVDKFLSESSRPIIRHRLLITTTDRIGANAKRVCDEQEKPVTRFMLSDFEKSAIDYPTNFADLPKAKRKPRPEPREHQIEAITAVAAGLKTTDRGQLIMACGTGKTFVTLWIKEQLAAECTLVLLPSLNLLAQSLREWTLAATTPFAVLCVCSDQTVGIKGQDEAIHSVSDLAFPVTSEVAVVKNFLSAGGNRVIFSTYQSSLVVAAAQAESHIPAFDLVVADEAHRCAGKVGSDFSTVLDNAQIRSTKRLFATATPRTYSSTVHKAAEDRGVEVVGMDNAALFGEVLYALPFGKAIERKLLTDYRVVIIGVDDPTIADWIANRELVSISPLPPPGEGWDEGAFRIQKGQPSQNRETDSAALASQIGLLKTIKDYDLKRVISFHSRVNRAEAFTRELTQTMSWISDEHRPSGTLRTDFVSGNMPANKRKIKLDQLKALSADERGVLSNARCLSEGVDVPSLDGVAFIDPRSSQVDIIQAVGRAIRLSPDKKLGTIVLPVFIAAGEDAASTLEASNFKPIWDVLNALKAHDDVLADELDNFRTEMGRKSGSSFSAREFNKIAIDLPVSVDANFSSALRTYLVEQVTASWNFFFGLLEKYANQNGNCFVPALYKTEDGFRLGQWVTVQRVKRNNISSERKSQLEKLSGWSWDVLSEKWEKGFHYLKEFADREGNTKVPVLYKSQDGFRLGQWATSQRGNSENILPERKARLEALPGWRWDVFSGRWEEKFNELLVYRVEHGDVNVPRFHPSGLGAWVHNQRHIRNTSIMPNDRIKQLEEIGFNWNPQDEQWEVAFDKLIEYKKKHGHINASQRDVTGVGRWSHQQRMNRKKGKELLSVEQIRRLDEIGFEWTPRNSVWNEGFKKLLAYNAAHGNVNVPKIPLTDLGTWVSVQRRAKNKGEITDERIRLLDEIGFIWNAIDFKWDKMFAELCDYKKTHGHLNIPTSSSGLGSWVHVQRRAMRNGKLSEEKIQRLKNVDFVWKYID